MPVDFTIYGRNGIDDNTIAQMRAACDLPVAVAGSLQSDAHLGYGLPIGGVLATNGVVIPYAVGVDIACRMKLSVFDIDPSVLDSERELYSNILERETHFGVGVENPDKPDHPVLYEGGWDVSPVTLKHYTTVCKQLGTSGGGNHFVEWGVISGSHEGPKVALLSHSGSRGCGSKVCNYYSKLAKKERPRYGELAWLELDSILGQEYWQAMRLMGRYAAANHEVIHKAIAKSLGCKPTQTLENHHNFAWKEIHDGHEVIVHRKGATPAAKGELGIIPGSMGTPTFIVEGKGNPESLYSSSHGAGRIMSRKQAKKTFDYETEIANLADQDITVLSAGADEMVGAYKDIHDVMWAQRDLVRVVAKFDPKIVKMAPYKKKHWEK